MDNITYICSKKSCVYSCIQNHKECFAKSKNPEFKESTKYQITEVPEPVYYLDIQYPIDEKHGKIFTKLFNWDRSTVNDYPNDCYHIAAGVVFGKDQIPESWIKQKQPEPTREELQERIKDMLHAIAVRPKSYERICRIAKGERP